MIQVDMQFIGLDLAGGDEYLVEVPRVPVVGDLVKGPDDFGVWEVRGVTFDYHDGFAFEPTVRVLLGRR